MVFATSAAEEFFRAVLQGVPPGAVYALIAVGFVLTYKTSGVFNLAFGAQAFVSACMFHKAHVEWEWPIIPAVVVSVVVLAPAIGLLLERLIFRHLRTASAVSKLVASLGLMVAVPELFKILANFEAVSGSTPRSILPDGTSVYYDPFGVYPFTRNELAQMALALVGVSLLGVLFRYTAMGLQMRAVVESPRMAELRGVRSDRVSACAWALSSLFAGSAGVLIAPRFNTLVAPDFFNLVVVAVAAAAVGALVSIPRALLGGLGLGVVTAILNTYLPKWADTVGWLQVVQENLTPSIPFVALFSVLVLWPSIRRAREAQDPLAGVDPPPHAPAVAIRSVSLKYVMRGGGTALLALAALWTFTDANDFWMFLVTKAVIMAIILSSVTVFTGLAGQISLCQASFAAIGGFTVYQLSERWNVSVLVGVALGAVIAAAVGALLSLPVLRLGGIWLALATLAFALFFDAVMVKLSWVGTTSLLQTTRVPRPTIGPVDFSSSKSFLLLCIAILVVVGVAVILIREGTTGRTLRALRGSELAAQSIAISPARARISAFALSAAIAGIGGALLSIHQENVNYGANFVPFQGLFWLVLVVTTSARTMEGACQAGAVFALFYDVVLKRFGLTGQWQFVLFGLGAIQYARHPEGLLEFGKRRFITRQEARLERRRTRRSVPQHVTEGATT